MKKRFFASILLIALLGFASAKIIPIPMEWDAVGLSAEFSISPTSPVTGQSVIFDAVTSTAPAGKNIIEYNWVFGDDDSTAAGKKVIHLFKKEGAFKVKLTIKSDDSKNTFIEKEITIKKSETIVSSKECDTILKCLAYIDQQFVKDVFK